MTGRDGLEPIESAGLDELRALQLDRLKRAVRHAYERVTHYRKKFEAAGVHPDDVRALDDLAKFPFTTKDDLRANYPFGMFAVPMEEIIRIHASSGTTGKQTVVGYTRRDIETWAGLMARSIRGRNLEGQDPYRLWLWAVHRRSRRAFRGGIPRRDGHTRGARLHGAPGTTHHRLQARHHHGDAVL
jgi:phenylacetate-coenzyme A ligase PaaK-like adenylate-forming protein